MVKYRTLRVPDLQKYGPRLEIEVGPPIVRTRTGLASPESGAQRGENRFSKMPALIDTGAGRTVVTPEVINRLGLPKIDVTKLTRAGGITENAGVYVAAIQFPRYKLSTIEVINIVCCELPHQPIQCLLGRDVLSRWLFTYDGPSNAWEVQEEDVAPWVTPPEGIDE